MHPLLNKKDVRSVKSLSSSRQVAEGGTAARVRRWNGRFRGNQRSLPKEDLTREDTPLTL